MHQRQPVQRPDEGEPAPGQPGRLAAHCRDRRSNLRLAVSHRRTHWPTSRRPPRNSRCRHLPPADPAIRPTSQAMPVMPPPPRTSKGTAAEDTGQATAQSHNRCPATRPSTSTLLDTQWIRLHLMERAHNAWAGLLVPRQQPQFQRCRLSSWCTFHGLLLFRPTGQQPQGWCGRQRFDLQRTESRVTDPGFVCRKRMHGALGRAQPKVQCVQAYPALCRRVG